MDILFDIGNVIINVDFVPALRKLIPPDAQDTPQRLEKVFEKKDEFEAGRISADAYFPWVANTLGFTGNMEQFHAAWLDIFSPNTPMWQCIEKLADSGHRLILFSNINNPHKEYLLTQYPIFNTFTGGIFSYQTGHIKPEPAIYQLAIKQYQLDPAHTLYIDDLSANIQAGMKAGFKCHQYSSHNHQKFTQWLNHAIE